MIGDALTLTARDLGLGILAFLLAAMVGLIVIVSIEEALRRAERHHHELVERAKSRARAELLEAKRGREEIRSYNARPTADERWGRAA